VKRFQFRLETPLKLRRRKVDTLSRLLADARTAVTAARKRLDLLEQERRRWFETRPINAAGELDAVRDRRRVEYLDLLDEKITAAQQALVPRLAAVAARESELRAAVRDREILERLKDIRRRSHLDEIRALETKRADFAAATLLRRNVP
jgi:flagellar biosynthesis chaperone FliJ